jgi:type II secretory pathway component PulM
MKTATTAWLTASFARVAAAWQACSARERQLVFVAAAVLAVGGAVASADWVAAERLRLSRAVPRAAAQLESTQEAATEIAALHARSAPPRASGPALVEAVVASAKSRGLALSVQASGEGLQIRGNGDFDELMTWLATLQSDQGQRVVRIEIQRSGAQAGIDAVLVGAP